MKVARYGLLVTTLLLTAVGVVMVYSASCVTAFEMYRDSAFFLKRHVTALCLGLLVGAGILLIDYRHLRQWAKPFFLLAGVLMVATFLPVFGREVAGAQRWLRIGPWSFQPSELAGMALIMYLADFLARRDGLRVVTVDRWLPLSIVLSIMLGMILAQPDLGTTCCYGAVALLMCWVAGLPSKFLWIPMACSVPAFYAFVYSVPYRWSRITAFLNPERDPQGSGFQLIQSLIALGSGGVFGVGLGHGSQKLFYLPAAHTDFLFAILGEEMGLLGTAGVVGLFILWLVFAGQIACRAQDAYSRFLAAGLTALVAIRAVINLGVNIGTLPTKGLPLPFISYGGSALIACLAVTALLLNIDRHRASDRAYEGSVEWGETL